MSKSLNAGVVAATLALVFSCVDASAQVLRPVSSAAATQQVQFSVFLPLQNSAGLDQLLLNQQTPGNPQYHVWLTPAQFKARFGAKQSDIDLVTSTLQSYGLKVTATYAQAVHAQGTVQAAQAAFGVKLSNGMTTSGKHGIIADHKLVMPGALSTLGARIPSFSPMIRTHVHSKSAGPVTANRKSNHGPYWFTDLKQAYDFPSFTQLTGAGATIAIVIPSAINQSDITEYFTHEGLTTQPTVTTRTVDGGTPFDPNSDNSFEAELDVEQSGGMAPGANIEVYNIADLSDEGILDGYLAVVEDDTADIVNSSFGGPEAAYLPAYNSGEDFTFILDIYSSIFKQGNVQGITFVASSGDYGANDVPPPSYFSAAPSRVIIGPFVQGVENPASNPNVTAVGGTNLITSYIAGSTQSTYVNENALGDPLVPYDPYGVGNYLVGGFWGSGGGISQYYPLPAYQNFNNPARPPNFGNMRNVPDVALHMGGCPGGISHQPCYQTDSADYLVFNGGLYGVIGTSASSPDFAGLLALQKQYFGGRAGNENFYIYQVAQLQWSGYLPYTVFRDSFPGDNGYYRTGLFYNHVIGVGSVDAIKFLSAPYGSNIRLTPAGNPGTPSNP